MQYTQEFSRGGSGDVGAAAFPTHHTNIYIQKRLTSVIVLFPYFRNAVGILGRYQKHRRLPTVKAL